MLPTEWTSEDKVCNSRKSPLRCTNALCRYQIVVHGLRGNVPSQAYLRRLVYEKYFRKEPPLPDEKELVLAIEGFGPFRAMQVCPLWERCS